VGTVSTVRLPGIGEVDQRWVWVGLAAAGGIALWVWSRGSSSTEATTETDPLTGLSTDATVSGDVDYANPAPVVTRDNTIDDSGDVSITTNSRWSAVVTEDLGMLGYEPGFVGATLGKYLSNQPLKSDEAELIRTAWAYRGKPPEGPTSFTTTPGTGAPSTPAPAAGYSPAGRPLKFYTVPAKGTDNSPRRLVNIANKFGMSPTQFRTVNTSYANQPDTYLIPGGRTVKVFG
jgi:hypothetical protein